MATTLYKLLLVRKMRNYNLFTSQLYPVNHITTIVTVWDFHAIYYYPNRVVVVGFFFNPLKELYTLAMNFALNASVWLNTLKNSPVVTEHIFISVLCFFR